MYPDQLFYARLLFVLGVILEHGYRGLCEIYPPLIWSPLNPAFRPVPFGTENDTVYSMNVLPMSKLYIICPNQVLNPTKVQLNTPKELLYENLWIVDKNSFDSCQVNTLLRRNKQLMECTTPLALKYYPLVFQDFSATADVLEFERGKDYFFIATSNGQQSSLQSTRNGRCQTHNMKLQVHVCHSATDPVCNPTEPPTTLPTTTQATTTSQPTTQSTPTTLTTTTAATTTTTPSTSTPTTQPTTLPKVVQAAPPETPSPRQPEPRTKEDVDVRDSITGPRAGASKGTRCPRDPEDTTWLILVAVMGAIIAVSISCNIYILCCKKQSSNHQPRSDDKRSSAAHALLRENSRIDKV
ncbi:ephrin-B2 [Nematostella vectensis]|uniref:ephrin-B2 n=1 Tax=Nematostella vectensis TaxID=45351 RepID=UPI00207703C1|nr:ephrin-B2 [Nematostella vectensis]